MRVKVIVEYGDIRSLCIYEGEHTIAEGDNIAMSISELIRDLVT